VTFQRGCRNSRAHDRRRRFQTGCGRTEGAATYVFYAATSKCILIGFVREMIVMYC
jgi:hypothetical protein